MDFSRIAIFWNPGWIFSACLYILLFNQLVAYKGNYGLDPKLDWYFIKYPIMPYICIPHTVSLTLQKYIKLSHTFD